ncbi:hypothetical protein PIB30_087142 [Stylosanthes scabra]|uniref:Uncharacterized protein n=1 Tax=Stylosanthes scabra TaxID=79078 RepID=A0ABU6US63_9FABA|nr:hypothetical protein [Stylosanthes scabra]
MGRDADGIWFWSVSPIVFQMQPVNTLKELKSAILRNMGAVGSMLMRRVAHQLLNLFPPNQFKFKIFWVDSDAHVRAMLELHRRYGSRDLMELLTKILWGIIRHDQVVPRVHGRSRYTGRSQGLSRVIQIHCARQEPPSSGNARIPLVVLPGAAWISSKVHCH